ncbi:MAG: tetratricopeptide repeat protein [Myxococcota bacterium]|nr:tetratricopeptide repeat protein [Myxococcota bacterium]
MNRVGWTLVFAMACGASKEPTATDAVQTATEDAAAPVVLSVDERVARAAAWLTTGNPADSQLAVAELTPLIVEAPERADIPYNLGLAHHQLEDGLNARKYYLRSTAIDPTLGAAWLNLGALSEQGGQYRRALQHYRAGMQNDPDMPELVVGTIGVLRRMGRHDEALREGKAALSRDANNIDVYNNLGLVYIDQGKPDLAKFIYQKALNTIDGADNNATLHANLGRAYLAKESPYNAKRQLEKALDLDPDLVPAMLYLADLALNDRDWAETARLLERAVTLEPENAAIHMNLGIAYRGLKEFPKARQSYETALKLEPENPDAYINIGLLLGQHENDFEGGIAAIQQYRTRGGDHSATADALLGEFQQRKEKFEADLARQAKREADRKKREEEARLAAEYEAMQAQWREEQEAKERAEAEARQRAEAAAAAALGAAPAAPAAPASSAPVPPEPAPIAPEPAPIAPQPTVSPSTPMVPAASPGGGVWGTAPVAAPAEPVVVSPSPPVTAEPTPRVPSVPAPEPLTPPASAPSAEPAAAGSVWGAPAAESVAEPAAVPDAAPASVPVAAPVRGTRQAGAPCATDNQCMDGLVCGGGVCTGGAAPAAAPVETRGTRQAGAPCSSDNQCAAGLGCTNNACAATASSGGDGSWGGW